LGTAGANPAPRGIVALRKCQRQCAQFGLITQTLVTSGLCFGSLTGGTEFVTVAMLLPNALAELSAAYG
jgi:hypothetical protein